MAILPPGQKPTSLQIGGSPRGWTFIHSAKCWRHWALRYLMGLFPSGTKDYFDLGSAYHALMEGQSVEKVTADWPAQVEEAQRLERIRKSKGPPLGRAVRVEQEYAIFSGQMTSKPDREEGPADKAVTMRDYKTSFMMKSTDDLKWATGGGIIGQLIASGTVHGIVDIISKREGKEADNATTKPVKLVEVRLTPAKERALALHVSDFWDQLENRVRKAAGDSADAPDLAFPPNLDACVGDYGPCDYYHRCWGKAPESLLFKLAKEPPRRWVTGRDTAPLKLPGKLTKTLIQKAYNRIKAAWFGASK